MRRAEFDDEAKFQVPAETVKKEAFGKENNRFSVQGRSPSGTATEGGKRAEQGVGGFLIARIWLCVDSGRGVACFFRMGRVGEDEAKTETETIAAQREREERGRRNRHVFQRAAKMMTWKRRLIQR
jgi:hypothetical protein